MPPPPRASLTERATKRYLFLAVRRGDGAEAERYAKDLAGLRGDPSAWGEVLAEAGGPVAWRPEGVTQAELDEDLRAGRRKPRTKREVGLAREGRKRSGLAGVYDRNPKVCLTATATVSAIAGVKMNEKLGPQTVLGVEDVQPSTLGIFGLGGLALLARQMGWRRTAKLSAAGAVGQAIATGIAHAPEGSLMAPKKGGPKT